MEAVVEEHLRRQPCIVSFSGGRDSSAVLAVATQVARRRGVALPIPVTFSFSDVPATQESEWQERIIDHLGLDQWVRIELRSELDLLGEVARTALLAHGPTWPPNAYLHLPIFEHALGGTVLTGLDGDGLFGDWRWCHAQSVLHRRQSAEWRDAARIGLALAPQAIRSAALGRRTWFAPEWLTPSARQAFLDRIVGRAASEPRRWDQRVGWHARSRALQVTMDSLSTLAGPFAVQVAHPLLDPRVIRALGREGGPAGYGDRTDAMRHLFGDLLPVETIERRTKAVFGGAVWRDGARAFAENWDGRGFDPEMVIPELLQDEWRSPHPVFHSWSLLQEAWLAGQEKNDTKA
jgi:asparagine synthase (glutamine-hydrolysing)